MIAGEVSGDKHGAILIKALKAHQANIHFRITGGAQMEEAAGVKSLIPPGQMAVMGFFQLITKLFAIFGWLRKVQKIYWIINRMYSSLLTILASISEWLVGQRPTTSKLRITYHLRYGPGIPQRVKTKKPVWIACFVSFPLKRILCAIQL